MRAYECYTYVSGDYDEFRQLSDVSLTQNVRPKEIK